MAYVFLPLHGYWPLTCLVIWILLTLHTLIIISSHCITLSSSPGTFPKVVDWGWLGFIWLIVVINVNLIPGVHPSGPSETTVNYYSRFPEFGLFETAASPSGLSPGSQKSRHPMIKISHDYQTSRIIPHSSNIQAWFGLQLLAGFIIQ